MRSSSNSSTGVSYDSGRAAKSTMSSASSFSSASVSARPFTPAATSNRSWSLSTSSSNSGSVTSGKSIAIFWNLDACPLPPNYDPYEVTNKIIAKACVPDPVNQARTPNVVEFKAYYSRSARSEADRRREALHCHGVELIGPDTEPLLKSSMISDIMSFSRAKPYCTLVILTSTTQINDWADPLTRLAGKKRGIVALPRFDGTPMHSDLFSVFECVLNWSATFPSTRPATTRNNEDIVAKRQRRATVATKASFNVSRTARSVASAPLNYQRTLSTMPGAPMATSSAPAVPVTQRTLSAAGPAAPTPTSPNVAAVASAPPLLQQRTPSTVLDPVATAQAAPVNPLFSDLILYLRGRYSANRHMVSSLQVQTHFAGGKAPGASMRRRAIFVAAGTDNYAAYMKKAVEEGIVSRTKLPGRKCDVIPAWSLNPKYL